MEDFIEALKMTWWFLSRFGVFIITTLSPFVLFRAVGVDTDYATPFVLVIMVFWFCYCLVIVQKENDQRTKQNSTRKEC